MSAGSILGSVSSVLGPGGAFGPGGGGPSKADGFASSLSDGLQEVNNQIGGSFSVGSGSRAEGATLESTQRQSSSPTQKSDASFPSSVGSSSQIPADNSVIYIVIGSMVLIVMGTLLLSAGRTRK